MGIFSGYFHFFASYWLLISLISIVICVMDKRRSAIRGKRRVPERTLLFLCLLGGSAAMLVTMLLIRHKTRKSKFMIGIPVILLMQYLLIWFLYQKL